MDVAAVALQLGLTGATGADGALLPLQVLPHTGQAGQQILVLGQLHLQAALAGAGPLGEDVQNEGGPVHHRHPQLLGEHPLLRGREGVVKDDNVRSQGAHQLLNFGGFALADEGAGLGIGPILQHGAQAGAPSSVQQSRQLLQGLLSGVLLPGEAGGVEPHQDGAVNFFYLCIFEHRNSSNIRLARTVPSAEFPRPQAGKSIESPFFPRTCASGKTLLSPQV